VSGLSNPATVGMSAASALSASSGAPTVEDEVAPLRRQFDACAADLMGTTVDGQSHGMIPFICCETLCNS